MSGALVNRCCYLCMEMCLCRSFIDQLVDYSEKCDALLEVIQNALNFLKEMKVKHAFVSTKTDALHQACQKLMDDQTKLMRVADGIADKLQYFNNCDKIGQVHICVCVIDNAVQYTF